MRCWQREGCTGSLFSPGAPCLLSPLSRVPVLLCFLTGWNCCPLRPPGTRAGALYLRGRKVCRVRDKMGSEHWHQHTDTNCGYRCSPAEADTGRWNLAFQKPTATSATDVHFGGCLPRSLALDSPEGPEDSGRPELSTGQAAPRRGRAQGSALGLVLQEKRLGLTEQRVNSRI